MNNPQPEASTELLPLDNEANNELNDGISYTYVERNFFERQLRASLRTIQEQAADIERLGKVVSDYQGELDYKSEYIEAAEAKLSAIREAIEEVPSKFYAEGYIVISIEQFDTYKAKLRELSKP